MTDNKLTPKQEAFALKYVECGNASEAYRHAYDAENMKDEAIWVKACEVKKNGKVAVKILELQEELRQRHNVTVDSLTDLLWDAADIGRQEKTGNVMVSAAKELSVLHGLRVERHEQTVITHEDRLAAIREKLKGPAKTGE